MTIQEIEKKYLNQIDSLDLELIIAHVLKKNREFVLAHPEFKISKKENQKINTLTKRRLQEEPLAYILDHKEFFGLDFEVNKETLIPRPETELLVEKVLKNISKQKTKKEIIDIGTGSGNIIISLACNIKKGNSINYFGIDISKKALEVAKKNARKHKVNNKIVFMQGNLLEPVIENLTIKNKDFEIIALANLPYLSRKIYEATKDNVKKFEPRSALYSSEQGLFHYKELLNQIKNLINYNSKITIYLEISPEQRKHLLKIISNTFPEAKFDFYKDLSQKWRLCKIDL